MEAVVENKLAVTRYPAYKDSGVEWLGKIPAHWGIKRLKYLFNITKRIAGEVGYDVLSITQSGIKVKDVESGEGQLSMDYSKYQLIGEGDFAMNHMDLLTGYVDISKYNGVVSPDYRVFTLGARDCSKEYLLLLLQLGYKSKVFYAHGQGVSLLGRWRFPAENFNNFIFPIPPLQEQTCIASFLDRKTAQIDKAIAQKERLIELLKERRQIMIHQAVTRGLNPDAPMKDSGVEWIGKIPEHWSISKLSYLTYKIGDGLHGTPNYTEGTEYHFINGNNLVNGDIVITEQTKTVSEREYLLHKKELIAKTLLLSINGTIGNLAFYRGEKVMLGKSAAYLNFFENVNVEYIRRFLESSIFKNYYELELSGSTINNFSLYSIGKTPIILPSDDEQNEIFAYLEKNLSKIKAAISSKKQEIEKLKEYKATLINSVVTGKIKVG